MKKMLTAGVALLFFAFNAFGIAIDTKKSDLSWKAYKGYKDSDWVKLGAHNGKISIKDGNLEIEEGQLKGGEIVVDMTNFTVEDLSGEWAEKFIGHMKSGDFFKVDEHPTSKLKIKNVKGNKVTADLTINGITKEVKFDYKKVGNAYKGDLKFNRTDYNIVYASDPGAVSPDKAIHHHVDLNFSVVPK